MRPISTWTRFAAALTACALLSSSIAAAQTPPLDPGDLAGTWDGPIFCDGARSSARLSLTARPAGGYDATLNFASALTRHTLGATASALVFAPAGRDTAATRDAPDPIAIDALLSDGLATMAAALRFDGACEAAFLVRFTPAPGIAGVYAQASSFQEMCFGVAKAWAELETTERAAGEALKTRLPDVLAGYDPASAAARALFSPDVAVFAFGGGLDAIPPTSGDAMLAQLGLCPLLIEPLRDTLARSLFLPEDAALAPSSLSATRPWAPRRPFSEMAALSTMLDRAETELPDQLVGWRALKEAALLEEFLRTRVELLQGVRPSALAARVAPMAAALGR